MKVSAIAFATFLAFSSTSISTVNADDLCRGALGRLFIG
jgi:hypothetical protein